MAERYSYQGFTTDGTGRAIAEASILVNEAGSTAATIYTTYTGGSADADSTITSDEDTGYFQFFVSDADYSTGDAFDIIISKTNYNTTTMEDVTIF